MVRPGGPDGDRAVRPRSDRATPLGGPQEQGAHGEHDDREDAEQRQFRQELRTEQGERASEEQECPESSFPAVYLRHACTWLAARPL